MATIKEETTNEMIERLLKEADALINDSKKYFVSQGKTVDLTEYITIKEYCKRFNIPNMTTVTNWIRRGVIPADHVITVPEFNDIRLIKAIPYRD